MSQIENKQTSPAVRPKVVVIGGGVTGLAAAYEVIDQFAGNVDVLVLEAMGRVGGTINTYDMGDLVLELGPDSFFTQKPVMLELCKRLGIENRVIWTNSENRRTFIAHQEKLWTLPEGFAMFGPTKLKPFFDSPLFSFGGKLRALMDLVLPKSNSKEDESLSSFVRRRMGDEVLERVIQPLVAGIYTADPDQLSVRAALPRLYDLEQKYGSVTRGLMAEAKKSGNNGSAEETEGGPRYGMFASLDGGMSVLIDALIRALPLNTVKTQAYVVRIEPGKGDKRWDVISFDGTTIQADGVIIATPSLRAADVIHELNSEVAEKLRSIHHASSIVVNAMFYRDDVPHPIDGFGFVVPRSEKRSILACSFSSNKFVGRAPKDKVLMRIFFGGALQPEVYDFADEHLQCLLWEDLHTYLGIRALPVFTMVTRYPQSMPQYKVGHGELIDTIFSKMNAHPGIELAGNAYQGVGIPDCVLSGQNAAKKVVALIRQAAPAAVASVTAPAVVAPPESESDVKPVKTDENPALKTGEHEAVITGEHEAVITGEHEAVITGEHEAVKTAEDLAVDTSENLSVDTSEQLSVDTSEQLSVDTSEQLSVDTSEHLVLPASESLTASTTEPVAVSDETRGVPNPAPTLKKPPKLKGDKKTDKKSEKKPDIKADAEGKKDDPS